jgi:hypothetical protein
MTAAPRIIRTETSIIRRDYLFVRVHIQNIGGRPLGPGTITAKQVLLDGSLRSVEFFNSTPLSPGDTTKISQLLSGLIKDIEFKTYREMDGEVIPLSGFIRRYSLSRVLTEAAESFLKNVLVPLYHAVTAHVQAVQGATKKWMRVARTWHSRKSSALGKLTRKRT